FLAPIEANEPWLSSALARVSDTVLAITRAGVAPSQILFVGFSQGACLALEWVARNARRYGGVVGFSGGLIGPDKLERRYEGSLESTPVFLGCSDTDVHIPRTRVVLTAQVFYRLGGDVTMRLYPNMGHTINHDEIEFARGMAAYLLD
ncbi:MAG: alpha/beta hydrolase, partial [Dehalococcoidia bacterium]|nr:alpha/beta hydrolase [Dehalococcoidia bacterium]